MTAIATCRHCGALIETDDGRTWRPVLRIDRKCKYRPVFRADTTGRSRTGVVLSHSINQHEAHGTPLDFFHDLQG